MSREQFIERFFPLNTEEDKLYGWYLTQMFAWRVFEIDFRIDSRCTGLELKAITYGRDTITFYDSEVGMGRDIYSKPLNVTNNYTRAVLDDILSEASDDAKVKQRTWGSEPIMYDFSSELECSYKIPVSYMTNLKYVEHFEQMLDIHEIYYTKNQDYGDAFTESIDEFGPMAALVRMTDKMSRLKNLLNKDDGYILDESVDDTLIDLANYAIMTALHLRSKVERDKHTDD